MLCVQEGARFWSVESADVRSSVTSLQLLDTSTVRQKHLDWIAALYLRRYAQRPRVRNHERHTSPTMRVNVLNLIRQVHRQVRRRFQKVRGLIDTVEPSESEQDE